RAEVAQERVRDVRVEDLDLPALPLPEEQRQAVREPQPGHVLEEDDRRQWRPGLRLEEDHRRLTALVVGVEREQERHDQRHHAETRRRRDDDDDPGGGAVRDDVAVADRQQGAGREVDRAAEVGRRRLELVAQREEDQPERDEERGQPGEQQEKGRGRGEQAEDPLPRRSPVRSSGHPAKHPPRGPDQVATNPEPARRRPGDDDRLEDVPRDEDQEEDAEEEPDQVHRSPGRRTGLRTDAGYARYRCFFLGAMTRSAFGRIDTEIGVWPITVPSVSTSCGGFDFTVISQPRVRSTRPSSVAPRVRWLSAVRPASIPSIGPPARTTKTSNLPSSGITRRRGSTSDPIRPKFAMNTWAAAVVIVLPSIVISWLTSSTLRPSRTAAAT